MKDVRFRIALIATPVVFVLVVAGCGTVQEGTNEESDWTGATSISQSALLEYRIDSLVQENRKLQQQVDNAAAENRNLSARNSELEMRPGTAGTPVTGGVTTTPSTSPVTNPGYESALTKFRSKRYQDAVDEFSALLSAGIGDDLADNCRYWMGESYFAQKKNSDAIQAFESVAGTAGSDKADDAQLMLGNAYAAMGNKADAKQAYQRLISDFPSSPLVKRARAKLTGL